MGGDVHLKLLILDIECDGLDPTRVWVACTKDYQTGERRTWLEPDKNGTGDFLKYIRGYTLVAHNGLGYDIPVLNRLLNAKLPLRSVLDTLVLSRLANSWDYSSHSLGDWGERLGYEKFQYTDWSALSTEMVEYCVRDVEITEQILKKLEPWWNDESQRKAIRLELDSAIICEDLQRIGFPFNVEEARELITNLDGNLDALRTSFQLLFPPRPVKVKEVVPKLTRRGTISRVPFSFLGDTSPEEAGYVEGQPFSLIQFQEFDPSSTKQRIDALWSLGWRPTDKTDGHIKAIKEGNTERIKSHYGRYGWKVNDTNLSTLPRNAPEAAKRLVEWLVLSSRKSTLESWIGEYNENTGRIHGKFNHIGAWTHRKSHSGPNMANIPAVPEAPKGREPTAIESIGLELNPRMRGLWRASPGKVLVGCDAEGIQLRILAHYVNDEAYTKAIVDGRKEDESDIHSVNRRLLGLPSITRDHAKTFIYAWILGASVSKVADILDCNNGEARRAVDTFLRSVPGLKRLRDEEIRRDVEQGFFIGLDGRYVKCDSDHLMLAGYLQNGESIIMKVANRLWRNQLEKEGIWYEQVNDVHDEWQTQCDASNADRVGEIQTASIRQAGIDLGLRCRLDGKYKVGRNWAETH